MTNVLAQLGDTVRDNEQRLAIWTKSGTLYLLEPIQGSEEWMVLRQRSDGEDIEVSRGKCGYAPVGDTLRLAQWVTSGFDRAQVVDPPKPQPKGKGKEAKAA
jgi:hypothetical protein